MSFSDLRSARKLREAKSLVEVSARPQEESNASTSPNPTAGGQSQGFSKGLPPLVSGLALSGLPPTLEIRESSDYGRGLYAKEDIGIGQLVISLTMARNSGTEILH